MIPPNKVFYDSPKIPLKAQTLTQTRVHPRPLMGVGCIGLMIQPHLMQQVFGRIRHSNCQGLDTSKTWLFGGHQGGPTKIRL